MDKKDKKIKSDAQDEVKTATAQAVDTQQEEPTSSETAGQEANLCNCSHFKHIHHRLNNNSAANSTDCSCNTCKKAYGKEK